MTTWLVDAILFDLDGTLVDSAGSVRTQLAAARRQDRPAMARGRSRTSTGCRCQQVMAMLEPDMPPERVEELRVFMVESESTDIDGVVAQPRRRGGARRVCRRSGWRSSPAGECGWPVPGSRPPGCPPRRSWSPRTTSRRQAGPRAVPDGRRSCSASHRSAAWWSRTHPAGVASARAAGCPVIGVLTTHDALDAPSVPSLADVRFTPVDGGIEVSIPDAVCRRPTFLMHVAVGFGGRPVRR